MTRQLRLSLGQRMFVKFWRAMTMATLGMPLPFMEELVHTHGVREFLRWAKTSFDVLKLVEARWGRIEGQLVIGLASLWSGCRYCGVGHLMSHNLELFEVEGILGPLDERKVVALQMMTDEELLAELLRRFSGPRWADIHPIIERQYQLRMGMVEEETRDDRLLQLAGHMWEWYNECSITMMDMDPADITPQSVGHAKAKDLIRRYRQARDAQAVEAD